jgi:hypothetical protein
MAEQCNSCGKNVTKYVLFEVAEFEDVTDDDPEIRNYHGATICNNCEMYTLGQSRIFRDILCKMTRDRI